MRVTYTQVPATDITAEELLALWQQGKLFVQRQEEELPLENIKNNVRAYVLGIRDLATEPFRTRIDALWDEILEDELYDSFFIPDPRARKCRTMNKNGVMRIVGVLRSLKVYADVSDSQLCALLEQRERDCSYRAYLGRGVEDAIRKELKKLVLFFLSDAD